MKREDKNELVADEVVTKCLCLVDDKLNPRVALTVRPVGCGLILHDDKEKICAWLVVTSKGSISLDLFYDDGKHHAGLHILSKGSGLCIFEKKNSLRALLDVWKGGPILSLFNKNSKYCISLDVRKKGAGLCLYDEKGNPRIGFTALKKGSTLILLDEKGELVFTAPY